MERKGKKDKKKTASMFMKMMVGQFLYFYTMIKNKN